jgi:hypothetical protein
LCCERIICISIISYGKIHFDIRVFWITSTFLERIMLAIQGSTVPVLVPSRFVSNILGRTDGHIAVNKPKDQLRF